MLTLLPLSGLQTALKRRNSKTMDFGRRDSISVYATYSLPTSKSSLRRFSSYDELAPIFQHLLADEGKATKRAESPLVEVATTAGTTSSEQKPSKLRTLSLRRGSISFGKNKTLSFTAKSETSCADLDAQLTKIKSQLVSDSAVVTLYDGAVNCKDLCYSVSVDGVVITKPPISTG